MCRNTSTLVAHYNQCKGTKQKPNNYEIVHEDNGMKIEIRDDEEDDPDPVDAKDDHEDDKVDAAEVIKRKINNMKQTKSTKYATPKLSK